MALYTISDGGAHSAPLAFRARFSPELLHDTAMKNPYIIYPINLERWLMEGSYAKVWGTCAQVPAPEYSYFVDSLMGITRNEIARYQEAAYESLTLKDAATLSGIYTRFLARATSSLKTVYIQAIFSWEIYEGFLPVVLPVTMTQFNEET
ncbi:hypothetical protein B0H13DRAFT_2331325 [Mycena leptocephala]|nr:hypothetical protein B0H13DRAFT_2331325 [Mycena leptocephala]